MTTKAKVLETLGQLPEEFPLELLMDRLVLLTKIEEGLQQSAQGKVLDETQAYERLQVWLKP